MKRAKIKGQNQKTLMWLVLAAILVSLVISGSGQGRFFRSASTLSLTSTPTPTSLMTIKLVSYNVLFGAGVDRQYDDLLAPELRNKNRLPKFVSVINGVKPDILGIQEANGWNK